MTIDIFLTNVLDDTIKWSRISDPTIKEEFLGALTINKDLFLLIEVAEELGLKCLSFLDPGGNTIYNNIQVQQLWHELGKLKQDKRISKDISSLLEGAIEEALPYKNMYLVFEGQ